jgi:hypothetical protein
MVCAGSTACCWSVIAAMHSLQVQMLNRLNERVLNEPARNQGVAMLLAVSIADSHLNDGRDGRDKGEG